jgi:ERCC4-type nuclease
MRDTTVEEKSAFGSEINKIKKTTYYPLLKEMFGSAKNAQDTTMKSLSSIQGDVTGGRAKAMARANELADYAKKFIGKTTTFVKKNFGLTIIISAALIVSVYALVVTLKKK